MVASSRCGCEADVPAIFMLNITRTEIVGVIKLLGSPGGIFEGSICSVIVPLLVWITLDEVLEDGELEFIT
jgi:hypothetical protein